MPFSKQTPAGNDELDFPVQYVKETGKAFLLSFEHPSEPSPQRLELWLPKSQVTLTEDKEEVRMPRWLARANKLCD